MTEKSLKPEIRFAGFTDAWEQRKLSEIADIVGGGTPSTNNPEYWNGNIDWYAPAEMEEQRYAVESVKKITELGLQKSSATMLPAGRTVLFTSRAGIGKMAILQRSAATNQGFQSIVLKDGYNPYFIYSMGSKIKKLAECVASGSTFLEISGKMLGNLVITVPSIVEQDKIASYFQSLDDLITLHQRKYEKLLNVKKAMLEKMFPKDGANVPEIRFAGFTGAWEPRKVREITDRYDNLRIPVTANLRISGTTPYYGANGIQDYVDGFTHEGEFVLVAEDGANDLKNYPVKCVKGRIWVNNHAHVLQGKTEVIDNRFLAYSINQADIESLLVGGGRAKLNAEILMEIELAIPSKPEQEQIGTLFSSLDDLITLHQCELEKLKNIKKAMLDKMFV